MCASIKKLAKDLCCGRWVFFLEVGHNLDSLSNSAANSFRDVIGEPSTSTKLDDLASCMMYHFQGTTVTCLYRLLDS